MRGIFSHLVNRVRIKLRRKGNLLFVYPLKATLGKLLEAELSYNYKYFLRGQELRLARLEGGFGTGPFRYEKVNCFDYHKGKLITPYGFRKRVQTLLRKSGYSYNYKDLTPHPNPEVYKPDWPAVKQMAKLRHRQEECLRIFAKYEYARLDCPTGYGKSFLIAQACRLFWKAKFDIVVKPVPVAKDIYADLCGKLPDVGMRGGGKRESGRRVMVYTADSLQHSEGDADFLIGDEIQELGTENYLTQLSKYRKARMIGLSASHERPDGVDFELEGAFGPIRIQIHYQEAVDNQMIVPIKVLWRDVVMDINPCDGAPNPVEKARDGLWRNSDRNKQIAADAASFPDSAQVLIVVNTLEHAVHLKRYLPGFTLCYGNSVTNFVDMKKYAEQGILRHNEPKMTTSRLDGLKRDFEQGKLKKVIATGIWNRGVNFRKLQVLIRADAGGSSIADTQIPGRVCRLGTEDAPKNFGLLIDYRDQFDPGFARKAKSREKNYDKHGWTQEFPSGGSSFRHVISNDV